MRLPARIVDAAENKRELVKFVRRGGKVSTSELEKELPNRPRGGDRKAAFEVYCYPKVAKRLESMLETVAKDMDIREQQDWRGTAFAQLVDFLKDVVES